MDSHERVLGLAAGASRREIRAAYIRHALQSHPDRGGEDDLFRDVQTAYKALLEHAGAGCIYTANEATNYRVLQAKQTNCDRFTHKITISRLSVLMLHRLYTGRRWCIVLPTGCPRPRAARPRISSPRRRRVGALRPSLLQTVLQGQSGHLAIRPLHWQKEPPPASQVRLAEHGEKATESQWVTLLRGELRKCAEQGVASLARAASTSSSVGVGEARHSRGCVRRGDQAPDSDSDSDSALCAMRHPPRQAEVEYAQAADDFSDALRIHAGILCEDEADLQRGGMDEPSTAPPLPLPSEAFLRLGRSRAFAALGMRERFAGCAHPAAARSAIARVLCIRRPPTSGARARRQRGSGRRRRRRACANAPAAERCVQRLPPLPRAALTGRLETRLRHWP